MSCSGFDPRQRTSSQCIQRRCIHSTVDCQSIVQTECQSSRQAASTWHRVKMGPMSRGTDAASWLRDIQRADGHLLMSGPCRAIPHCCNRLRAKEVAEVLCGCCQICPGFNLGSKPSRCGTRLKASNQAWKRERSAKEQGSNKRFTQFNKWAMSYVHKQLTDLMLLTQCSRNECSCSSIDVHRPSFSRPVLASPPKPLMVPIQRMRDAGFQKACVGFWIGKRCCRAYGVALCGRR